MIIVGLGRTARFCGSDHAMDQVGPPRSLPTSQACLIKQLMTGAQLKEIYSHNATPAVPACEAPHDNPFNTYPKAWLIPLGFWQDFYHEPKSYHHRPACRPRWSRGCAVRPQPFRLDDKP